MRSRRVSFSQQAQDDLFAIETWLETEAGKDRARRYVDRLIEKCMRLDLASRRGTGREDLFEGLRIVGFERRITIAFVVDDLEVVILRIFRAGQNWETEFTDE